MKKQLYFFIGLFLVFTVTEKINAQLALPLSAEISLLTEDSVQVSLFGLFLTNTSAMEIGTCSGVRSTTPGLVFDDNNTHFTFARECGPQSGVIVVTTPFGNANGFFVFELPGPDIPRPSIGNDAVMQVDSKFFEVNVVPGEVLADTVKEYLEIKAISNVIRERGIHTWTVPLPIPDPIPTTRFADPSDTFGISDFMNFGDDGLVFQDRLTSIGFPVFTDSVVVDTIYSEPEDSIRYSYYFTWVDHRSTEAYPLFEGLGGAWVIGINPGFTDMLTGSFDFGNDTLDFTFHNDMDMDAFATDLANLNVGDTNSVVSEGGYGGYSPRWVLNNTNSALGEFPEMWVKLNQLTGGTDQPTTQTANLMHFYYGTVSAGDLNPDNNQRTAQFVIRNEGDSTLHLGTEPIYFVGPDSLDFFVAEQPAETIAVGDSSTFSITFMPDSIGVKVAFFIIKDYLRLEGDTKYLITGFGLDPVPVELTSFSSKVSESSVTLLWSTATETNNSGFKIERAVVDAFTNELTRFENIGFVAGKGTTAEPQSYSFTDNAITGTKAVYRLKQTDYDGTYEYSDEIEVTLGAPTKFELAQNYPNPFNPTTNIKFSLPETAKVNLTVFNSIGQQVAILVDEVKEAGYYRYEWNAVNLASGVYFLRISAGSKFNTVKKMMLLK